MAPYHPLFVLRSDGKLKVNTKTGIELNEPLKEQLNEKPNAQGLCDFYRQCTPGDIKEADWRRKLGGMLIRELGDAGTKDKNYILANLPENYRVYEHVKFIARTDGKPQTISNKHAAGGNERQDAYLYGYPTGRKKRYRSPAEFFPHLLWLCTDASGDSNNCSCKFCSPEELESEEKIPKPVIKEAKQEIPATKTTQIAKPSAPVRKTSQQSVPIIQSQTITPTPLPRIRSREQLLDSQYAKFMYRPGEVAWFSRGTAWGLSCIVKREEQSGYRRYLVQPLSHPQSHPQPVVLSEHELRPWLAWSPPSCTNAGLNPSPANGNRQFTYDNVDWRGVLSGKYGQGDAEVDGSIMSVKTVETTLTLLDRTDAKMSRPGAEQTSEVYYNAMYLGGEKIWLGEPLRLRNGAQPTDIMVLTSIIERQNLQDPIRPHITLLGDTYSLRVMQIDTPDSKSAGAATSMDALPARVREDVKVRNQITSRASVTPGRAAFTSYWKLQVKAARLRIEDIKGRWYESSLLMPVLDQAGFNKARENGDIQDAGLWMNGQGDCNKAHTTDKPRPAEIKTKKREDAFGRSIPQNMVISKGLDEATTVGTSAAVSSGSPVVPSAHAPTGRAVQAQLAARAGQALQQQQQRFASGALSGDTEQGHAPEHGVGEGLGMAEGADGGFDEYMNLGDAVEIDLSQDDAMMPGFGQEFAGQELNQDNFFAQQ